MHLRSSICTFLAILALPLTSASALEAVSQQEIVRASLVSEHEAIQAGQPIHVGVLLEPQPGWHTYWENPGDAGMATSFKWTLPEGFTESGIQWPAPERVAEGTLVTHSYHDTVFLPVTITPPASLDTTQNFSFKAKATWLVCKDICIPETAELELTLPAIESVPVATSNAALFAKHREHAVKKLDAKVQYNLEAPYITLTVPLSALDNKKISSATFFPRQYNVYEYGANQDFAVDGDTFRLKIQHSNDMPEENSTGILSLTFTDNSVAHYDITLSATATVSNTSEGAQHGLISYILLAIMGGLILNLMPCVLPVLSLKTLAIVKKAGQSPAAVRRQGLAYTFGILLSFTLVAGLLIALRNTGEAIGWGYQMQSPAFVGFLAYLLFVVGLNLSGLFDMPVLFGNSAANADDSSLSGSFYTGILATAVATPCTAPFMATAVGAALTMPAIESLLIFAALGLGLALPFLLISFFPALLRFLPKPGAWMERFKQFLAFPMYASVIWLLWVLVLQTGAGGLVIAMGGMLALVVLIWFKGFFEIQSKRYLWLAIITSAAVLAFTLPMLEHMQANVGKQVMEDSYGITEVPYSKDTLSSLIRSGKPVFVNATAAWCLTCQLNAKVAIHTQGTAQLFKDKGVTYMVADWTRPSSEITEFLSSFGHKGVPLYVYYPPSGGKPLVLDQLLTENTIASAIAGNSP